MHSFTPAEVLCLTLSGIVITAESKASVSNTKLRASGCDMDFDYGRSVVTANSTQP